MLAVLEESGLTADRYGRFIPDSRLMGRGVCYGYIEV